MLEKNIKTFEDKMLILDFDGVLTNNKVTISDQGIEYVQ